ncbi:MAG TPA: phenylacetate--CoA ligase PaaK [Steroidobacteraceae bacterium]|jgi:phenylacetate-CoA ligase|nr:phenylacetate--CoA ligase PaaK [Steroidobacteraceae bacterium]
MSAPVTLPGPAVGEVPADARSAEPVLSLERPEIEALQLERLRWTLHHAYEGNPCYRRSFDAHGVRPDDLTSLADLARFPFTTKADLRAAYPFGFFAVPMDRVARIHASSGTTGKPTVVGYTRKDIETWSHLVARSIRAAGGRRGMRVHIAYGYGLFTGGLGAHFGAEAAGCTVIPVSGGYTERQVQLIMDLQPDIIMITPSYMLALLDEFRRQGIDPRSSALTIGIFGAEPWGEGVRQEIESAFGIDACDIYGLSEVMGPGVAQEFARSKEGPTIWEDHFLPEVVDPESGEPLGAGEQGELVFTSLTKEAMPVIRYRTRDLTRLLAGNLTAMRRFAKITGRTDDMLIVRGVNLFPSQIEELILQRPALAPHYQIEVSRPHRMDEVVVIVEARPDLAADSHGMEALELGRKLKSMVGITAEIRVVASGTLQRSTGKALRVIDRR